MPDPTSSFDAGDVPTPVRYILIGMLLVGLAVDVALLFRFRSRQRTPPAAVLPLTSNPWTATEVMPMVLILLLLRALLLVGINVLHNGHWILQENLMSVAIVLDTLFFHGAALCLIVVVLRKLKLAWRDAFGLSVNDIRRRIACAAAFYVGAMPIVLLSAVVYAAFLIGIGYPLSPDDTQDVVGIFTQAGHALWLKVYIGIVAVTLGPLVEELLFRGIALPLLARYVPTGWAVCLVSAMFALLHFHVPTLVPLFVIAVAFSYAYIYTGSILVPVAMHSLFNGVSLVNALFMGKASAGLLF